MDLELSLIAFLRKIQVEWELNLEQLSRISHVEVQVLKRYIDFSQAEIEQLPTIPPGMDPAVPLVSIFRNLKRKIADSEKLNQWLKEPNELFEGNRPIEVMAMSPQHLMWVSYTLESSRFS